MDEQRRVHAWWGEEDDEQADDLTADEVEALLARLADVNVNRPILVNLTAADGDVLTVGVGHPVSVLTWMAGSAAPPYLTSATDLTFQGESVWFDLGGSETEFGPEAVISLAVARATVRGFVASGDLSGVAWTEE